MVAGARPDPGAEPRTYVRVAGVPAVWFLSLDAASLVFATIGRALYGLRYRVATMTAEEAAGQTRFRSAGPGGSFAADYAPAGRSLAPSRRRSSTSSSSVTASSRSGAAG